MAVAGRGIVGGQLVNHLLAEKELEELGLGHVGGQFDIIEAALAKLIENIGLVVLEYDQVHGITSGDGMWEDGSVETGVRLAQCARLRCGQ